MHVVTVGHVTNDHLTKGLYPGGAALYSALAAQALGAQVTLVTRAGPDFVGWPLCTQLHSVHSLPASHTTTFDERYVGTRRVARLLARAGPVDAPLPLGDVVLLCPVTDEVPVTALELRPGRLLAAGLQGWLRAFGSDGLAAPRPPLDCRAFLGCGLVSCSAEDLAGLGPETLRTLRDTVPMVAVTDGAAGARVYTGEQGWHIPALAVNDVVDPTGAGDVFFATLALQLARGMELLVAARWAACAGAWAVTCTGPSGLGRLGALPKALEEYRRQGAAPRPLEPGE
jgi:1D-myo-inositol 3-kinase